MKKIFTLLFASISALSASAQCPGGQVMVTVDVATDQWGYECYWEVTPTGAGCGVGTLAAFGNTTIGCAGGGLMVATATDLGAYADNTTITESLGCVPTGTCVDIHYVDDFGDGGATFTVNVNGIPQLPSLVGAGNGNVWNACATSPMVNNVDMMAGGNGYTKTPLSQATALGTSGSITSMGSGNVTGATMMVTVLQGATTVYTATSTAQNITSGATANFTVAGFVPTSVGTYTVNYTSDITETDEDLSNNVFTMMVEITDSIYARDNGMNDFPGGVGFNPGLDGQIGNAFTINNGAMLSSVSVDFDNTGATDMTGTTFAVQVFDMVAGVPTNVIGTSAMATVSGLTDSWYVLDMAPNLYLAPGTYVVSQVQYVAYTGQIGFSNNNFTPATTWAMATSVPWDNIENLGIVATPMVRANINQYASIDEMKETALTVYPNPAQNELNVSGVTIGSTINVYNNVGQVVLSAEATNELMTLNVANFVSGIYTVKTISGTNVGVAKFVKK